MEYLILIIIYLNAFLLSKKVSSKIFNHHNNIIIQSIVISNFVLLLFLFSVYLFLINVNLIYLLYSLIILTLISTYVLRKEIIEFLKDTLLDFVKENKLLFIFLLLFFLTVTLPSYDQDSLRYHLNIAKKINNNTFYENTWLDYLGIGPHEFINAIFLKLNFLNTTSSINFLFLVLFVFVCKFISVKYKNKSNISNSLILLSAPFLISQIVSQKLFFFPSFIIALSIFYLFNERKNNLSFGTIVLILLSIIFCLALKPTFAPLFLISYILSFMCLERKKKIYFLLISILSFFIIYGPIIYFRYKIYDDPFLPFISINGSNQLWFSEYVSFIKNHTLDSSQGLENGLLKFIAIIYKLFLPLDLKDFFKIFGIGFLYLLTLNLKKNKDLAFLLIFLILSVLVLNNFQNRWFLPVLIFICFYADLNKYKFFKKILYFQSFVIMMILIPMALTSVLISAKILNKNLILNEFNNSYSIIQKINSEYPNHKIYSSHNSFYFFNNVVPIYHPKYVMEFDKNYFISNKNDTKLLLWEGNPMSGEFGGLDNFLKKTGLCGNVKKIETYYYRSNRWVVLKDIKEINLFKFDC